MKIFISSTYEDLKAERKEAIATIDRIGQAIAMEKFFSSNHQSKSVCLSKMQQCNALILILGFRYGYVDSEENISITEIEYNTAKSLGLPIFVFIKKKDEKQGWATLETDPGRMAKHNAFKSRLDIERFRTCFVKTEKLGKEIIGAIREYEIEHGIIGAKVSVFLSPQEFFKPFSTLSKLFNHALPLVGRVNYLKQLNKFASSKKRVITMYGRGGIGKSKILFEFSRSCSEKASNPKLLFLREGVSIDKETAQQLPAKPCLIVVDDAHRREDLKFLFSLTQQYPDRIKLILSGRPEGKDYVNSTLSQTGFAMEEVEKLEDIKELSYEEVKELAGHILGPKHKYLIDSLCVATKDCPLATVIGGRLIAADMIDPKMLERHGEFQATVFNRFQDIIIGEVSKKIDSKLCRSVLALISALSPIRLHDGNFQKQAAEFLKIEKFELIDAIGILEQNGILLRRGYKLRITPDVLSDHILFNICVTPKGDNTGYAKQIFDAFHHIMSENVLLNLAELDWRIKRDGHAIDLLKDIWKAIEEEFRKASHYGRGEILGWLKRIAYYQPEKTLELVEFAISNPATGKDEGPFSEFLVSSHARVLEKLPSVIQGVTYNLKYLPRCCNLLWQLGYDDTRSTNSFTEHAIRILEDLAGYDIGKPVEVNRIVLEVIEDILKKLDAHSHVHSPIDILDPMLAKEGDSTRSEGFKFVFRPFAVSYENTRPIREKVIELLANCTESKMPKVVLRTLKSLISILRNPMSHFGRQISDEEINQWLPEKLNALEIILNLVKKTKDTVIHISVFCDLGRRAKRSKQKEILEKVQEIIKTIPDSFEFRLLRALWNRYERDWDGEDYDKFRTRIKDEVKQAVTEFLNKFTDSQKIFNFLNKQLKYFQICEIDINPNFFLILFAEENPKIACQVCELIIENIPCALEIHFSSMLYAIRQKDKNVAINLIRSAVDNGRKDICLSIAHAYAWGGWEQNFCEEDIKNIKDLLSHQDRSVRIKAISCLKNFKGKWQKKGINLAINVDIGDDEQLSDVLCEIFHPQYGIPPDVLKDEDIQKLLSKMLKMRKLSDHSYHIEEFLKYITERNPLFSAGFLIERYKYAIREEKESGEYQPMPYLGFRDAFQNISSRDGYTDILKEVRDLALDRRGLSSFWLPNLFKELADGFCPKSLKILEEWIDSDDEKKIRAASLLLRNASSNFVFGNSDFVKKFLEGAYAKGEDCYQEVNSNLFRSVISEGRQGTSGQPMPQDVALKDQSEKMCQNLSGGSPAWRFYDSLRKHAEDSIRDSLARDEEFLEN